MKLLLVCALVLFSTSGCVQMGELAQTVGGGLTEYSRTDNAKGTFLGGASGVAGKVYTQAGGMITGKTTPASKGGQ